MKANNQKTSGRKYTTDVARYSQNNNTILKDINGENNVNNIQRCSQSTQLQRKEYRDINKSQYATKFSTNGSQKVISTTQRESYENSGNQTFRINNDNKDPKSASLYYVKSLDTLPQDKLKTSFTYSTRTQTKTSPLKGKKIITTTQEKAKTFEESLEKESKRMLNTLYAKSLKTFKPITTKCSNFVMNSPETVSSFINVNVCPRLKDIVGFEVNETIFDRNLKDFIFPEIRISLKKHENDFLITRKNVIKLDPFFRTSFNANINKCRYKDVYCLDKTRVRLQPAPEGTNDFIHANYVSIRDYIDNYKMICAQGPLPNTIVDFWRMIMQEKCRNIVMLTQCYETVGKSQVKKCEQYWPLNVGEIITFGNIKICNIKITKLSYDIQVTDLEVKYNSTVLNVSHILMSNWPDKGTPKIDFAMFIILQQLTRTSPSVIHCSAGIGRTGTLAAIDMLLARLSIDTSPIPLAAIIQTLRLYRHGAVQTESQFSYVIRVMIQLALSRGVLSEKEVATWYAENDITTGANSKR